MVRSGSKLPSLTNARDKEKIGDDMVVIYLYIIILLYYIKEDDLFMLLRRSPIDRKPR